MKLIDKIKNFFNNIKSCFTTKPKVIIRDKVKAIETKTNSEENKEKLDQNLIFNLVKLILIYLIILNILIKELF